MQLHSSCSGSKNRGEPCVTRATMSILCVNNNAWYGVSSGLLGGDDDDVDDDNDDDSTSIVAIAGLARSLVGVSSRPAHACSLAPRRVASSIESRNMRVHRRWCYPFVQLALQK